MNSIILKPIGLIFTPFTSPEGMPVQPNGAIGITGSIEVFPEYVDGLKDLDGFSHIMLIYYFHQVKGFALKVKPFMDNNEHGVFSTRAPKRPNAIGFSVVKLLKIENNRIIIENVDMLNETPLLDIKPYITEIDSIRTEKMGWLKGKSDKMGEKKSDNRFSD